MKKIILTLMVLVLAAGAGLQAQDNGKDKRNWQDRWKAEKIAFLTDAMELTSAEAEKFWPVYNKCESEKKDCFVASMEAYKALDEALQAGKSDSEVKALLDKYLEANESGKDIDRKYAAQYRKILSDKKVAKLFIAEESFRRQQIHRLHKNGCDSKQEK